MKRIVSFSLIYFFAFSILAKDMVALGWEVWYVVNRDYVARELCVNTARPQLKCNGKCHLAKQLRKLEQGEQEKKPATSGYKLKSTDWITAGSAFADPSPVRIPVMNKRKYWTEEQRAPRTVTIPVFHPPASAC